MKVIIKDAVLLRKNMTLNCNNIACIVMLKTDDMKYML